MLETLTFGLRWPNDSYNTQDGLYDVAWSEIHENQLVSASGDGSLKLWDITINVCHNIHSISSDKHAYDDT